jgi:trehalose transport system substrate-binding protein
MQNWPFGYKIITEVYGKQDIDVYHGFPGPVREAHVIGGDVFGIPIGSQNKNLALAFMMHVLSREVQTVFVEDLSWPSLRSDVAAESASPVLAAVAEALRYGVFRKNVPYWSVYQKLFEEAFLRVVAGGEDIRVLDELHVRMLKIIQKYE